jgi:hypothetical protein
VAEPGAHGRPDASHPWLAVGLLFLCGATSLAVFFRDTLTSRFDLVSGNVGDNRLYIVVLEHWLAALRGEVAVRSPMFFWPEPNVLGYTDCVALLLPPFAIGRALGLDRYLALQGAFVFTKALGFVAMHACLRRLVGLRPWAALLGAALFTISNANYLAIGHGQLTAVAYVPLLALLSGAWWRYRTHGRPTAARCALAGAAVLLALLLLTSYYVGWFTIFVGALMGLVAAFRGARRPWPSPADLRRVLSDGALALGVFAIATVPFCTVYLPALHRVGGRHFDEVRMFTAAPWHVIDVGFDNVVWGGALARLAPLAPAADSIFAVYESQRGWPPLLLSLFVATMFAAAARARCGGRSQAPRGRVMVLGTTALLAWVLATRWGRATAWKLVFLWVPGASAIRVPVRINLVINLLVIAVAMIGLDRLRSRGKIGARWRSAAVFGALGLVLLIEELNTRPVTSISRTSEYAAFARIGTPPAACRAFYVVKPATTDILETARGQIDAMLIAYDHRIPTLNGWSGNQPPGWNLNLFDEGSAARAQAWAAARGVADGLCELDLATGSWSVVGAERGGARPSSTTGSVGSDRGR